MTTLKIVINGHLSGSKFEQEMQHFGGNFRFKFQRTEDFYNSRGWRELPKIRIRTEWLASLARISFSIGLDVPNYEIVLFLNRESQEFFNFLPEI